MIFMNPEPNSHDVPASDSVPSETGGATGSINEASDFVAGLTKEEQWALFEKELKESDWGHQPC